MRNEIAAFYFQMLDDLIERNDFFKFYFQSPYTMPDYEDLSGDFDLPPTTHLGLYCGATRGTLVSTDSDEVVKFNLDLYEDNACEMECSVYAAAIQCNLDRCFAKAYYLGTFEKTVHTYPSSLICFDEDSYADEEGFCEVVRNQRLKEEDKCDIVIRVPLYAYTRAYNVGLDCANCSEKESIVVAGSYASPLVERYDDIGISFAHHYGEVVYAELSSFLNEWKVNDIHYGNIGWIDGDLVLIDYAGFHS